MSQSSSIPRLWEEISSLLFSAAAQSNELSSEHAQRIELVMLSSPLSTTTDLLDVGAVKKLVQAQVRGILDCCCCLALSLQHMHVIDHKSAYLAMFLLPYGHAYWTFSNACRMAHSPVALH